MSFKKFHGGGLKSFMAENEKELKTVSQVSVKVR